MAFYLDTSALVKLVVAETETEALRAWIGAADTPLVSSDLTRTELLRAVRRMAPDELVRARRVLDSLTLLTLTTATFESAARLDPAVLRSLDALHVASALELEDELQGLVAYDDRLAVAAQAQGIAVVAPA